TVSVSLSASPSALVKLAVALATPADTPTVTPLVASIVATAALSTANVAAGIVPVNGAPFWSNPTTDDVTFFRTLITYGPYGRLPPVNMSLMLARVGGVGM